MMEEDQTVRADKYIECFLLVSRNTRLQDSRVKKEISKTVKGKMLKELKLSKTKMRQKTAVYKVKKS